MALSITATYRAGATLFATLVRASDGFWWDNAEEEWAETVSVSDATIAMTEGTGGDAGFYEGSPAGDLGSPGTITVRIHESSTVIAAEEVYVFENSEGQSPVTAQPDDSLWSLLRYVTPLAGSCPENVQKQCLRLSARDFVAQTGVWMETVTDTAANPFQIELADDAVLAAVMSVKVDDVEVTDYDVDEAGEITFGDSVNVTGNAEVKVRWLPLATKIVYPQDIIDRYGTAIAHGAVARITGMMKPWKNPEAFQLATRMYNDEVGRARIGRFKARKSAGLYLAIPKIM